MKSNIQLCIPGRDDYLETHSSLYGATLQSAEGSALFDVISCTEGAIRCICATADGLPALAGVGPMAVRLFEEHGFSWTDKLKQFAGTVVAVVMRENGFDNTGKKSDPAGMFTSAEIFALTPGGSYPWDKVESA